MVARSDRARLANLPPCLIGMEACVGARHLAHKLAALGHDARLGGVFRGQYLAFARAQFWDRPKALLTPIAEPVARYVVQVYLLLGGRSRKGSNEPRCLAVQPKGATSHLASHRDCLRGCWICCEHAEAGPPDRRPATHPALRETEPGAHHVASGGTNHDCWPALAGDRYAARRCGAPRANTRGCRGASATSSGD
jgi:hypothetical protein